MLAALLCLATTACKDEDDWNNVDPSDAEDVQVNKKTHEYLGEMYLWNDEYKTLTPDFTVAYDDYMTTHLLQLTTNTLDKKADENGKYSLYSYVERRAAASAESSGTTHSLAASEKEAEYSYGITGITAVSIATTDSTANVYFCVQGVYPGSSAAQNGLKRGDMVSGVGGKKLTKSNYTNLYYALLQPTAEGTTTLTVDTITSAGMQKLRTVTATCSATYCNPVIFTKTESVGSHKVGYLVFDHFSAGFGQELYDAFADFKSQGVTDLILDLRYNRGGRTTTANLLATLIAGASCEGKVFSSMRYNDTRMSKRGGKRYDENFGYPNNEGLGASVTGACLDLTRVCVLTTGSTASASELVINALRGIGVEVTLVGERTEGKNVGMEYKDITASSGNIYRILPITFQIYNCNGESDYADGFAPDVQLDENNPYNQERTFYACRPYGSAGEPLYAKALQLLTGTTAAQRSPAQTVSPALSGSRMATSAVRPQRNGLIR